MNGPVQTFHMHQTEPVGSCHNTVLQHMEYIISTVISHLVCPIQRLQNTLLIMYSICWTRKLEGNGHDVLLQIRSAALNVRNPRSGEALPWTSTAHPNTAGKLPSRKGQTEMEACFGVSRGAGGTIFAVLCILSLNRLLATGLAPILPPLPKLPIPSARQLAWQAEERAMFLHFGMNTFTDSEWGTGDADPSLFNPVSLDAKQWVRVAKETGFSRVILTAKHHDGFCLWPSSYTNYSVKSAPWKNGTGDVVAELAEAAAEAGLALGLYLSPWDRHEATYGQTLLYNEFYLAQLHELLSQYGPIAEVWLDGAKGKDARSMDYLFNDWFSVIHQLQPGAVIFSDAGPDVRWIGDEAGKAPSTCWSMFNSSSVTIGDPDERYSRQGDPCGSDWVPPECDVSIRPGWFWHSSQHPKTPNSLLEIFYKSVGRNCVLLLNVPPNSTGLLADEDVEVLHDFSNILKSLFSVNFARNATVTASSVRGGRNDSEYGPSQILSEDLYAYWSPEEGQSNWTLYLDLREFVSFNVVQIQEAIHLGQRVSRYHLDVLKDEVWHTIINGTTIGHKKLERFDIIRSQFLRFTIDEAQAEPLIAFFGLYVENISSVYANDSSGRISMKGPVLTQDNVISLS